MTESDLAADFHHPRPDGPELFVRWRPAARSRGVVAVVHGFGEHSGRYEHLFDALGQEHLSCIAIDLRGFGQSDGQRGHVDRFEDYLDDTAVALSLARERCSDQPVFLLGHSMGGLVCARYAQERGREAQLAGLCLSSPAFGFALKVPAWKSLLGRVASRLLPGLSLPTRICPEELSHDPLVHAAAGEDPLMTHTASARWFTESLAAQALALDAAGDLPCPLLLLAAGSDSIVEVGASRRFLVQAEAGAHGAQARFYEHLFHEIFNELEREQVFADLLAWLDRQLEDA